MDAESLFGSLDLFKRLPRFNELLLVEQTILRIETLGRFL